MAEDTDKLRALLESLPQELYDDIYDLTFTADDDFVNLGTIIAQRKPKAAKGGHKLLAINRDSRQRFARFYYSNVVFVVYGRVTCEKWLKALPEAHIPLLRDIRCIMWRPHKPDYTFCAQALAVHRYIVARRVPGSAPIVENIRLGTERKMTEDLVGFASVGSVI